MNNSIRKLGENFKKCDFFKGSVTFDEPMNVHTTMKVGGNAAVFVEPQDAKSALYVYSQCKENGVRLFVLGGGSNLVVSDSGIEGVVLSSAAMNYIRMEKQGDLEGSPVYLYCGSGTSMDSIAAFCEENCLSGLENFSGLPGSCGGAAYMNARCYEKNISDVLNSATFLDFDAGEDEETCLKVYNIEISDWDYKKSPFMNKNRFVTEVCFKCFVAESAQEVHAKNESFVEDRRQKGHFKAPSAGSVFKNNRSFGKPSGKLVDEAGLKGTVIGGAQIAPWHGNFIINNGNASAADIKALVDLAVSKVQENTGFVMEPEIIFV